MFESFVLFFLLIYINSFLIAFDLFLGKILSDVINVKMIMAMCPEYSYMSMKTVTDSTV